MLKGILLHGGHDTRLKPLTFTRSKQLLPIANMPMSQYGITSNQQKKTILMLGEDSTLLL